MTTLFSKRDWICLAIFGVLSMPLIATVVSCSNSTSSSSQSSQTVSSEFTSEEDVKNFCIGKTFRPDFFNISTTVRSSSDVSVKEFSGSTAIVKVWFDMSEVYGRAISSGLVFKIDKRTGEYYQLHDYE